MPRLAGDGVIMAATHRLVELPQRRDARGVLVFGQIDEHLPYAPRRFFTLSGIGKGERRGGHAHRRQHQFLVMVAGTATVIVDNGETKTRILLDRPNLALHAQPMLWLDIEDFSDKSVCLVLASDIYDEDDYVRDYAEFRQLTRAG
jgi:hypothetical protein